jgi:hypothetical protein
VGVVVEVRLEKVDTSSITQHRLVAWAAGQRAIVYE